MGLGRMAKNTTLCLFSDEWWLSVNILSLQTKWSWWIFLWIHILLILDLGSLLPYNRLVGYRFFSKTAPRIFLIFGIKIRKHNGYKHTQLFSWGKSGFQDVGKIRHKRTENSPKSDVFRYFSKSAPRIFFDVNIVFCTEEIIDVCLLTALVRKG